jgi:RNA polymerase sigma-70 factor (ECF subfamily)
LLLRLHDAGEQEAWRRFIDLYTPLLYYWARRLGLPDPDAADLVQDVFVTLIQKMPQFQYDRSKGFRSWLRTVAENRWRDDMRKRAAHRRHTGDAGLAAVPDEAAEIWEAEYRHQLFGRAIQLMRSDFDEKTWKACWAIVVEGKSGANVAKELSMSVDAVYAAKSRVLRRLRQELDGLMD